MSKKQADLRLRCLDCDFYQPLSSVQGRGECRRHPPSVQSYARMSDPVAVFPTVSMNFWCGDGAPEVQRPMAELPPGSGYQPRTAAPADPVTLKPPQGGTAIVPPKKRTQKR